MGWLRRLFGSGVLERILGTIRTIAEQSKDLREYRKRVVDAVHKGELDDAFREVQAAHKRAVDYIEKG